MNKNLWIGVGAVVVIAVVAGMVLKNKDGDAGKLGGSGASETLPVIQIASGSAYSMDSTTGERAKELKSGDTLTPPISIQVSDSGSASVSFADGSVARIQGGTTFTVQSASYNKSTGEAKTSIFVKAGRVWSKVMELATPDSSWEVETSSAVATVRGTAFDTKVAGDTTVFAGSEHDVTVSPINPATHARLQALAEAMGEGKKIEITKNMLEDLVAGRTKLVVTLLLKTEKDGEWFSGNEREDSSLNKILEELRGQGLSGAELRAAIRAKLRGEKIDEKNDSSKKDDKSNNDDRGDKDDNDRDNGSGRGTLVDLWKSGKSQKCTFSFDYGQGKSEGTVYLADNKMRGDFKVTIAEEENITMESHMVRDKDWTYVWTSMSPQGFKMKTTEDISGLGSQESFDFNQMLDYNCSGWSGGNATFSLPSGVTFNTLR